MSDTKKRAIVALPCDAAVALTSRVSRRWLQRGQRRQQGGNGDLLTALGAEIDAVLPAAGLAALRLWGQSAQRPGGWVCGADPVWLQAGLDKLYLQVPPAADLEPAALAELFRTLQEELLGDTAWRLQAVGSCGYLQGGEAFATATMPAGAIAGERPDAYMPTGPAAHAYLELSGEIQLALHEHPYNRLREQQGRQALNSLWLWGGGEAPAVAERPLPMLYSDDPLLRGCWLQSAAACDALPATLRQYVDNASGDLVIDLRAGGESLEFLLGELYASLHSGSLRQLSLLFTDQSCIDCRPYDRFRFWRRPLLINSKESP